MGELRREGPAPSQQGDCSSQVTITETARQPDVYGATFKCRIDATSDAPSAVVHFKLARTFDVNGSPYSQAEPWSVVVRGGQGSDEEEVHESSSPRQIQWSVTDVFCRRTSTDGQTSTAGSVRGQQPIRGKPQCDLSGAWTSRSKILGFFEHQFTTQLGADGTKITGQEIRSSYSNNWVGEIRSDGTVELEGTYSRGGATVSRQRNTLRVNEGCSELEGTWVEVQGSPGSGTVKFTKQ